MLSTRHNYSLQPYNTFGMNVKAAAFTELLSEKDIPEIYNQPDYSKGIFVLGGGSNLLLTQDVNAWVLHNKIGGIEQIKEDENNVWLKAGGGVEWHSFVMHCVTAGLGGVENLSLIPGTVGAAPIQNIGAYGAEVKDTIEEVKFWHLEDKKFYTFSNTDCTFGYRDSIFKKALKGKIIIVSVTFLLAKNPEVNVSYGNIREELGSMGITQPTIKDVSDAVVAIRSSKLPNPKDIGNSGSFFKNPEINSLKYETLRTNYPSIPGFILSPEIVKVPAAWLIETCGWKGYRKENYGVHARQALVLVNHGGAAGKDIYELSTQIINSVKDKFGIELEREVQVM